jgi:hypothetical protein
MYHFYGIMQAYFFFTNEELVETWEFISSILEGLVCPFLEAQLQTMKDCKLIYLSVWS